MNSLAELDCIFGLAQVASQPGYTKPVFTNDGIISIVGGRHPMSEMVRSDPFVPNSLELGGRSPCVNIITGPNMGGKSSCVRMLALTCIMAQIGFYVPAQSLSLTPVDSVLTRMGGMFTTAQRMWSGAYSNSQHPTTWFGDTRLLCRSYQRPRRSCDWPLQGALLY